jgi:hypothetical protein
VNAAEIEKGHIETHGGFQMLQCFAKSETQASETAQMCPDAQIGAFDVRGTDSGFVGVAADYDRNSRCDFGWFIPVRTVSALRSVEFDQLGEINVCAEAFFDGGNVAAKPIGRKLESSGHALAQIADEVIGARSLSLGDQVGQNHFRLAINRHPHIRIAPLDRRTTAQPPLFGVNEGPELIGLNEARTDAPNERIENKTAVIASGEENRENRALVNPGDARNGANTIAFQQKRRNLRDFGGFRVVGSDSLAGFRESGFAVEAAVTLDSALAAKSETLRSGVIALEARHGLLFLREKPYNQSSGFDSGLRPLLNSASLLVDARSEALCLKPRLHILLDMVAPTDYRKTYQTAQDELTELLTEKERIERRIVTVRKSLEMLAELCEDEGIDVERSREADYLLQNTSLADEIRAILRAVYPAHLKPSVIKAELEKLGRNLSDYTNAQATVQMCLKRMVQSGDAQEGTLPEDGKKVYRSTVSRQLGVACRNGGA